MQVEAVHQDTFQLKTGSGGNWGPPPSKSITLLRYY